MYATTLSVDFGSTSPYTELTLCESGDDDDGEQQQPPPRKRRRHELANPTSTTPCESGVTKEEQQPRKRRQRRHKLANPTGGLVVTHTTTPTISVVPPVALCRDWMLFVLRVAAAGIRAPASAKEVEHYLKSVLATGPGALFAHNHMTAQITIERFFASTPYKPLDKTARDPLLLLERADASWLPHLVTCDGAVSVDPCLWRRFRAPNK